MKNTISADILVPGSVSADTFVLQEPLSFWGGLDSALGKIIDQWHPQKNDIISGKILIMSAGRGSSSGSSVLAEAIRLGNGPAGIILLQRDAIVTLGAMIAAELYDIHCPVVLVDIKDWEAICQAKSIAIETDGTTAKVLI
jgi:predicted aconitase with swiveling domain